jgi:hypothetical protein
MIMAFKPEGEVVPQVKHTWDREIGAPPIHHHDEHGVNSSNPAGGYVGKRESPTDRANRGEPSAPPV